MLHIKNMLLTSSSLSEIVLFSETKYRVQTTHKLIISLCRRPAALIITAYSLLVCFPIGLLKEEQG